MLKSINYIAVYSTYVPVLILVVNNGESLAVKAFDAGNYNKLYHHRGRKA